MLYNFIFRSVSERFDLAKSSLSEIFFRIIEGLNKIASSVIRWPSIYMMNNYQIQFKNMSRIQNVVGAVDGTYVPCKVPADLQKDYTNRKKFTSITLQAITVPDLKFIDCSVGFPSSVHDSRVFRNSKIYRTIEENRENYLPNNLVILGDKAYPLLSWCIPPFMDNGRLSEQQKLFNQSHAKTRQVVERSFALLFGRWRRLQFLNMSRLDRVPHTILGCCVLHNLALEYCGDEDYWVFIRDGEAQARRSSTDFDRLMNDFEIEGNELRKIMMENL